MIERTKIKVCGVRTPDVAAAAVEAGVDMIGVNFVESSPRCVSVEEARAIAEAVKARAEVVGLFVDAEADSVREVYGAAGLTLLQLHGGLSVNEAGRMAPMPYMRATAFDPELLAGDVALWDRIHPDDHPPRALLVDTPDPRKIGGGTGRTFDWRGLRDLLDREQPRTPIVLAGGLTPDNVAEAIGTVRPWMVDVSSGVESRRGVKDVGRIRAFCEAVNATR